MAGGAKDKYLGRLDDPELEEFGSCSMGNVTLNPADSEVTLRLKPAPIAICMNSGS